MEKQPDLSQLEVIQNFNDNILLFASAGTGKTFTVAQKVKRAIASGFCSPEQVLALTFTVKAANELREDITKFNNNANITVKTIHGFCLSVVREESRRQGDLYVEASVKDEVDVNAMLEGTVKDALFKKIAKKAIEEKLKNSSVDQGFTCPYCHANVAFLTALGNLSCPRCERDITQCFCNLNFNVKSFYNFVSLLKHKRVSLGLFSANEEEDYQRTFDALYSGSERELVGAASYFNGGKPCKDEVFLNCMGANAGYFMATYCNEMRSYNALDYDDLIIQTNRLFNDKDVLSRWAGRYRLVIVDEVQDTSLLEYSTIKKLFGGRVLLCGDMFQTIYEWRGSSPARIMRSFIEEYGAKVMYLNRNYRATQTLCNASFGYLKNTYGKQLAEYLPDGISIRSETVGEPIVVKECNDEREQAKWIYSRLKRLDIKDFSKVCIVGRSNYIIARTATMLEELSQKDGGTLRFFTLDKDFQFYRRPVSKDIFAFLNIIINPNDVMSFERIALSYIRDVGKAHIKKLRQNYDIGVSISAFLNGCTYSQADPYADLVSAAEGGQLVVYDLETTGLDKSYDQIIQIAAVKTNSEGRILARFNRLVMPEVSICEDAANTHGYTLEKLKSLNAVDIKEALSEFVEFCGEGVLIGHNNSQFDNAVLDRQLRECNLTLSERNRYDTLCISKCFLPSLSNYKLETLCANFDIINEQAHDALFDVYATCAVASKLLTQYVIPTMQKRRDFMLKNRDRFIKFYQAYLTMVNTCKTAQPHQLLEYILRLCRIEGRYKSGTDARTIADIRAVFDCTTDSTEQFVRKLCDETVLSGSQIDTLIKRLNKIPIITVHQTKGCEFETVFLINADENTYPGRFAVESGCEDEEKRVFYVAISRAKQRLCISYFKYRQGDYLSNNQSPYIAKIPEEYIERE